MTEQEERIKKAIEQLERISKNLGSIGESVDYTEYAINALKKQIHKKAINIADEFGDITLSCPCCRLPIIKNPYSKNQYRCCVRCGQKIDWSEEE